MIAANAASVLRGRRFAFSLGSTSDPTTTIADIWVLAHGRVARVGSKVREAGRDNIAELPSLSPDGKYIAFFANEIAAGAYINPPRLLVMRSDGSHAHELGTNLGFVGFSSLWMPSWGRDGRSFVVAAPKTGAVSDTNAEPELSEQGDDDTGIFRFEIPSGKEMELTKPGIDRYDYAQPKVSPDGRKIAYLRSALPEPSNFWQLASPGIVASVYVMKANGKAKTRLPLPPRPYVDLWWCGNNALCVDSPTEKRRGGPKHVPARPANTQDHAPTPLAGSNIRGVRLPLSKRKLCDRGTKNGSRSRGLRRARERSWCRQIRAAPWSLPRQARLLLGIQRQWAVTSATGW